MGKRAGVLSVAAAALLLSAGLAGADVIELDDGSQLDGKILSEKASEVVIQVGFGTLTIQKARIRRIEKKAMQPVLVAKADLALRTGDHALALRYLEEAIPKAAEEKPEDPAALAAALAALGDASANAKRFGTAEASFRRVVFLRGADAVLSARADEMRAAGEVVAGREAEAWKLADEGKALESLPICDEILGHFPERRREITGRLLQALRVQSEAAANAGDLGTAFRAGLESLRRDPEPPFQGNGWPRLLAAYATAAVGVEGGPALLHADALVLLGVSGQELLARYLDARAYEAENDGEQARQSYRTAAPELPDGLSVAAVRIGAERALGISDGPKFAPAPGRGASDVQTVETENFVVAYRDRKGGDKAREKCEEILRLAARDLAGGRGILPFQKKCILRIYDGRAEYLARTGQPAWSEGVSTVRSKGGELVGHVIETYGDSPDFVQTVLSHEIGHVAFAAAAGYVSDLPLWLQEGMAVRQERGPRVRRIRELARAGARTGSAFPIEYLLEMYSYPQSPEATDMFYAQSLSVVDFLVERFGMARIVEWSKRLKDIPPPERPKSLLDEFDFREMTRFEKDWKASVK
mgnify:CR=1 FL=1